MSWILLATPVIGTIAIVCGIFILRRTMPLRRDAPSTDDRVSGAVERTATMLASAVGAAMRDERNKGVDLGLESSAAHDLDDALSGYRRKAS